MSPAARTLVDDGLDDAVTYVYRVAAYDDAGNASPLSEPDAVTTPDTTEPSAPAGLTAVSAPQSVALTWLAATDNVGVTDYVVYRDGLPVATLEATATWWTDTAPGGYHAAPLPGHRARRVGQREREEQRGGADGRLDRTDRAVEPGGGVVADQRGADLGWVDRRGWGDQLRGLPRRAAGDDPGQHGEVVDRHRAGGYDAAPLPGHRPRRIGNESAKSNEVARTVDSTAPSVPPNLVAVSSPTSVALSWGAVDRRRWGDELRGLPRRAAGDDPGQHGEVLDRHRAGGYDAAPLPGHRS